MTHGRTQANQDLEQLLVPGVPKEAPAVTVPWLDGRLLVYLRGSRVLDIKAPGERDLGPIVPSATVAPMADFDPAREPSRACPLYSAEGYDAVFSRDGLSAAAHKPAAVARWFEFVRPGGHLVLVALQADGSHGASARSAAGDGPQSADAAALATARATSAFEARPGPARRPAVDAGAFRRIVETSLPAGGFAVVHVATTPVRGTSEGGAAEVAIIVQKLASSEPPPPDPEPPSSAEVMRPVADVSIPFMHIQPHPLKTPGMRHANGLLVRDFAPAPLVSQRILVLKLDHHGDLIIALPALRELRGAFPQARIRLVCGSWNVEAARASCVADEVRAFDYFPERAAEWTGVPVSQGWEMFASATEGYHDLAIDLRVDDDTRSLLARVDAGLRCGIGTRARFPMLDIALPDGSRAPTMLPLSSQGEFSIMPEGSQVLGPEAFESAMQGKTSSGYEATFRSAGQDLARSGAFFLPEGVFEAEFHISTHRFLPGLRGVGLSIEVVGQGDVRLAQKIFGRRTLAKLSPKDAVLRFESVGKPATYEFRISTRGRPLFGRVRFAGLRLRRLDANSARFSPSELHVGEKLSLLVSLIRQRVQGCGADRGRAPEAPAPGPKTVVIAPFSNSSVRDWPVDHYAALIERLVADYGCRIELVGAPAQVAQADRLVSLLEGKPCSAQVANRVGQTKWSDMPLILRSADLVVCNNSGIAHQAAELGARVLAIYSASHQPLEWGPRGPRSRAVMMSVACSPCGYERLSDCVNDHLCMRLITPELVLKQVAQVW